MMLELATLHNLTGGRRGIHDVACPACGPECKSAANRTRKVLRVWDDGEFVTYKCARCDVKGWAKETGSRGVTGPRPEPLPTADKSELALFLWNKAKPAPGSIVQTYLTSRSCWVESAALRFLPARGDHPPAMLARFGSGRPVTGVHLTKLAADGSRKAGAEKDKVMIGPSNGQPIIICDNADREELVIAEGIEDAASVISATGWSGWAAGSAGRIPAVVAAAGRYPKVYLAVDHDRAGKVALDRSLAVRPDLVPLRFAKMLGAKENLDANKALIRFGAPVLLATIDLCEAQAAYVRQEIGFHALQHMVNLASAAYRPFTENV